LKLPPLRKEQRRRSNGREIESGSFTADRSGCGGGADVTG
jgi:hypothetical protein